METELYESNETIANLITTKERVRNELADLKKVYADETTVFRNENKLSKLLRRYM
jgi:hypothetical protein